MSFDAHPHPRIWTLIACAGSGTRAATVKPKQFELLAGKPLLEHSLDAFGKVRDIHHILLVLAPNDVHFDSLGLTHDCRVSAGRCGGSSRALSVGNGLRHLLSLQAERNDWVLVHDAARCLILPREIQSLIDACRHDPVGGLLAHPVADTLKQATPGSPSRVTATVTRTDKWLAQTPQMFRLGVLADALAQAGANVTDESSAIEALGLQPLLVPSGASNFKLTYPGDFALAHAVLEQRAQHGCDEEVV